MISSNKLLIPKTIHVGFQNRQDTYTGKLGYVIYTDEKGKKRKETSWEGWRNKQIPALVLDNTPLSGFVLNKNVGGYKSSWNYRNPYIRVYDPRGFEFEISLENLLFILQETSSIKGKGLEGEFVYSWDGKELVLLPVDTEDYKVCANFTEKQSKKITKADIKEGHTYLMKNMSTVMYLGKLPYSEKRGWSAPFYYEPVGSYHIFLNLETKEYIPLTGYTKLAEVISTDTSLFPDTLTGYKESPYFRIPTGIEINPIKIKKDSFRERESLLYGSYNSEIYCLTKNTKGEYLPTILRKSFDNTASYNYELKTHQLLSQSINYKMYIGNPFDFKFNGTSCELPLFSEYSMRKNQFDYTDYSIKITEEELESKEFYDLQLISNKGKESILTQGFRSW